jgi:hypothetical protein
VLLLKTCCLWKSVEEHRGVSKGRGRGYGVILLAAIERLCSAECEVNVYRNIVGKLLLLLPKIREGEETVKCVTAEHVTAVLAANSEALLAATAVSLHQTTRLLSLICLVPLPKYYSEHCFAAA